MIVRPADPTSAPQWKGHLVTPPSENRRRILLTGATGFVGQAVMLALLERTDDVDLLCVCLLYTSPSPRD